MGIKSDPKRTTKSTEKPDKVSTR